MVRWRGRGIVIPGRSMTGKSSLVAALVHQGAAYYSDEYAVLDRAGRVRPYARALRLRETHGGVPTPPPPAQGPGLSGPIPVGLVIVTGYQRGARWQPRRMRSGEAALALIDNAVAIRARPRAALAAISRIGAGAVAIMSPRGDARLVAPRLLRLVQAEEPGNSAD